MKVTRIAYSRDLNAGKLAALAEIARRLGGLRNEVWQRYGSIAGAGWDHRGIRDQWLMADRVFDTPARLWKETLRATLADVVLYREAAKVKVRRAIPHHTADEGERKRLYMLLKDDAAWPADPYLRRMMRKYWRHGHTKVTNQIILDTGCYTTFQQGNRAWLAVMSLRRGQRIAIPLNTTYAPTGTLRLLVRAGRVEVHYCVDAATACAVKPCGTATLGIDKGYTEAFVDSDGERHGLGLGELLSHESDALKVKYQQRNRLAALADAANPAKAARMRRHNLGRQKLARRQKRHRQRVRDLAFKAAHSVVAKAAVLAAEDLTAPIASKASGKNQNRRLAGWVKGTLAEATTTVAARRGSALRLVNCAYTSQIDSRTGLLLGSRVGDRFYCADGVVLDADTNAARNVLARLDDQDIQRYTPYKDVRAILAARTAQAQAVGTAPPRL